MLANAVAIPDVEIAALTGEALIQWIAAEHGSGGDLVVIPEGGPTLDKDIGLQAAMVANHRVLLDNAEVADYGLRANARVRMYARSGSDDGRGIDRHKFV
jgi:hypothetical protein